MRGSNRFLKEIFIPFLVSAAIVCIYSISVNDSESLAKRITNINSSISNVIAIQVGFNITCLALIASFGNKTAQLTFKHSSNQEREIRMNQIVSSYIYGVAINLVVLILGVIHIALIEPLSVANAYSGISQNAFSILKILYFFCWCFFILHGFAVFFRNAVLIQIYLLVNVRNR